MGCMRLTTLVVFLAAGVCFVQSCTIEIMIISHTNHKVFCQFISPDGQKSPMWLYKLENQNERFNIKLPDCSKSPMVVETYEYDPSTRQPGKLIYSYKSFVNGNGFIDYEIGDDLKARMATRVGVLCSFGECGSRGKRSVQTYLALRQRRLNHE